MKPPSPLNGPASERMSPLNHSWSRTSAEALAWSLRMARPSSSEKRSIDAASTSMAGPLPGQTKRPAASRRSTNSGRTRRSSVARHSPRSNGPSASSTPASPTLTLAPSSLPPASTSRKTTDGVGRMRTSIGPLMRTGRPARPLTWLSKTDRCACQLTKCGPTSAATSARMIAIPSPSSVPCKLSLRCHPCPTRRGARRESVQCTLFRAARAAGGGHRRPARLSLKPAFDGDYMSGPPARRATRAWPLGLKLRSAAAPRYLEKQLHDLAGVHDVGRVERLLDGTHGGERAGTVLRFEIFHLALPDAVLARARALHGQRAVHQAFAQRLGARRLVGIAQVDQQREMEIAVADMAENRRHQPALGNVALRRRDAFGKPRDRHAHVGGNRLGAGAQAAAGPVGVVPRLPQARAIFPPGGPFERAAGKFAGDLAEALRLLGDAGLGSVELDEQHRHFRQRQLGIEVGRPHLQLVEQLDARHRNGRLDGDNGGVAGGLDRWERTHAGRNRLGDSRQYQRQRRDYAKRSFRP